MSIGQSRALHSVGTLLERFAHTCLDSVWSEGKSITHPTYYVRTLASRPAHRGTEPSHPPPSPSVFSGHTFVCFPAHPIL